MTSLGRRSASRRCPPSGRGPESPSGGHGGVVLRDRHVRDPIQGSSDIGRALPAGLRPGVRTPGRGGGCPGRVPGAERLDGSAQSRRDGVPRMLECVRGRHYARNQTSSIGSRRSRLIRLSPRSTEKLRSRRHRDFRVESDSTHNRGVAGSSPAPATGPDFRGFRSARGLMGSEPICVWPHSGRT